MMKLFTPQKLFFIFAFFLLASIPQIALAQDAPPQLTASQPADGATDVDPMTDILLSFNQPIVDLVGVDAQAELPQPLVFEPPVAGVGEWINTSIYRFSPDNGLAGSTHYTITLDIIDGTFSFRTTAPTAWIALPNVIEIEPDARFQFNFNHAMDRASTEAAFSLGRLSIPDGPPDPPPAPPGATPPDESEAPPTPDLSLTPPLEPPPPITEPVAGTFSWNDQSTSLTFTPDEPLRHGEAYQVSVAETARSANRTAGLSYDVSSGFTVVPLPSITEILPWAQGFFEDGLGYATDVNPADNVAIRFRTPMSVTTLLENISVTPALTETQVYSSYLAYENQLTLSWYKAPQSTYTVTIGADATDMYGNPLGETRRAVYTTGNYGPLLRLNMDRFTHLSAYTQTQVSALYRNVDSVDVSLYRVPETDLHQLTGSREYDAWQAYEIINPEESRVWSRSFAPVVDPNIVGQMVIPLTDEDDDLLEPGLYAIELDLLPELTQPDDENSTINVRLIVIGNRSLFVKKSYSGDSLAWLTDLQTGQPVAEQEVRFYRDGELIDTATTDADGLARAPLGLTSENGWVPLVAVAGRRGSQDFAVVSTGWNEGIGAWEFNINSGFDNQLYRSYFYTDRAIYRPGQTINWKGIVRRVEHSLAGTQEYGLPPTDLPIAITVRDDRGNVIHEATLSPNEFGTVNGSVNLSEAATSGFYYIEARIGEADENDYSGASVGYGGVSFQVGSYEKPEFAVDIVADAERVTVGESIRIAVEARYFSGGPLADAEVTWRVLADPLIFFWRPEDQSVSDGRYFNFAPANLGNEPFDPYSSGVGIVREGTGVTDANGRVEFDLPTDLADLVSSQNWTIDVTIQSSTNQFVSGSTRVEVHTDDLYVGLSPQRYVVAAGEEAAVDLVAVSPDGMLQPNVPLAVDVYSVMWNSVYEKDTDGQFRWQSQAERTLLLSDLVETDDAGFVTFNWTPSKGGQIQIAARSQSAIDPTSVEEEPEKAGSGTFVYAVGARDDFVPWRRDNNDRIDLVVERESYAPGDVAQLLVPSPFVGPVEALITIEQGGIIRAERVTLIGNSETISVPISAAFIPNVFVSVALVKGIDETNPTPAMRVGYAQINVETDQKALTVDVAPSAEELRPGETVTYTLTVRDYAGAAVPNTEVSVALIDKALLSLARANLPGSMLDVFYRTRPLGVEMGSLLVINQDRLSQQLAEDGKGGGGGGGPGQIELREEFPDSAHWRADYVSDANGQIVVAVPLPDNLTTWTLVALAVDAETRVGEAENEIVATKAVQIRPLLPRFFTAGDRARVGAVVVNASDEVQSGTLSFNGSGFTKNDEPDGFYELEPGQQIRVEWPIQIDDQITEATFDFVTQASSDGDAVRLTLPVRRYRTPEVVGSSGRVPSDVIVPDGITESIRLPEGSPDEGELRVSLEPSLAAGMLDGLDYLEHYAYECNEQTVSRFLPNLFSYRALQTLGTEDDELRAKLADQLSVATQRLIARQNGDGGWGYWPNEETTSFITAYVYWGLRHAANQGFAVPQTTLEMAHDNLQRNFVAPSDVRDAWRLNEMAFVHFVLVETGMGDAGRMSTLYEERQLMQHYGKALLAMALAEVDRADPRVQTLLDELATAAELTATSAHWSEGEVDYFTLNTNLRSTAIVLTAFSRLRPDDPLTAMTVRWLMDARQAGRWPSTQENAWSLIGLTDWLSASGELEGNYTWTASLNDVELGRGQVTPDLIDQRVELQVLVSDLLRDQPNQLRLTRDDQSGQLYYTTYLQTYQDALAVDAQSRGIVVERRFERDGRITDKASVGDVISVTVTIIAPTDLHHVLVEANLPAGLEPIDPNLATESERFGGPTIKMGDGPAYETSPWGYWSPTHIDVRDDKVAFFATHLPAGTVEYTFQARATLPGEFRVLPVHAEQMYFTETWGRSAGSVFTVVE